MDHEPLVLPQYGPSLSELYGARFKALPFTVRVVAVATAALLVAAIGWRLFLDRGSTTYTQKGPVAFSFRYAGGLGRVVPEHGQYVKLEAHRGQLFTQSFAVERLQLPPYRGDVVGLLPSYANRVVAGLKRRFRAFEPVQETRTFINQVPGYAVVFKARLGKRALFGRYVILPKPLPGSREGVVLLLLSTPAGGTYNAITVGSIGATKLPLHSFRFDQIGSFYD